MFGKSKSEKWTAGVIDTIIGKEAEIRGNIHTKGTLRIDGYLEGELIHDGHLIIGPTGRVVAQVTSKTLEVAGELKGNVTAAGKLELLGGGRVTGDIRVAALVVQDGGLFSGHSTIVAGQAAAGAHAAEKERDGHEHGHQKEKHKHGK